MCGNEVSFSVHYGTKPRLIPFAADPVRNFENNLGVRTQVRAYLFRDG
jgi:hypothetical protein